MCACVCACMWRHVHVCVGAWGLHGPVPAVRARKLLFFFYFIFILFIFGCVGSLLLRTGFSLVPTSGATLRCDVRASHCGGFSLLRSMGSRRAGFSSCGTRAQ